MSRILVIGGYGGFGARMTRRLIAAGHDVLVAGRSADKAAAFCNRLDHAEPVVADRDHGIGLVMARHRPDLVIDAAGPFQASGTMVVEACVAMRIPYLDLADARDFVTGIARFDAEARAAGVAIVSGASSVPALSGAVARHLAEGMDRVTQVDIAISASSRAAVGPSVARAILSYVGRPVRLWRGRREAEGYGWQELRRERFTIAGHQPLARWIALADVPDLEVLPQQLPGRPEVTFRAGTELGFQMIALWLLSWPVRWKWATSLRGLAGLLLPLQRLTRGAGSDRSAMSVTLRGIAEGSGIERRWTLIASDDDGPEIPTLAAALLAEEVLARRLSPGSRDGSTLLTIGQFEPLFAGLSIVHATTERPLVPLYARAMGERFDRLPAAVRMMHDLYGDGGAAGEGTVERGTNPIARLTSWLMRFPPAGTYPLHVAFAEHNDAETWTRRFGPHRFHSMLSQRDDHVVERFGPLRFAFALPSDAKGLAMELSGWSAFGVPLPRFLAPRIEAREWQDEAGRFRFLVAIRAPLTGAIIRYTGWLVPISS
jgi:predicted dinucleotide-binding enzyme